MTLTVQSTGDKKRYRLGISLSDSKNFKRGQKISVLLNEECTATISCGSDSKGFDIYSKEISDWIIKNKFHNYPKGKPTKLLFDFKAPSTLEFIKLIQASMR